MKLTGPQIISELRDKLPVTIGRHLYVVLGGYAQLERFEGNDLTAACKKDGQPFPKPLNLNRSLLDAMNDDELRKLVRDEAAYPQTVRDRLNQALRLLVHTMLRNEPLLIVKQVELLFAYGLDLSSFRTAATDQNHIVLLLPGEQAASKVVLFYEADERFHQFLPENLVAQNHVWELIDV